MQPAIIGADGCAVKTGARAAKARGAARAVHGADARRGMSLMRSGGTVAVMTLLSRVLGFVRDQVLAVTFGAGGTVDTFLVAFKIPNFLRRLFGEGAFAQAFVPVFTEYRETKSPEALRDLAAHVSGTFAVVLLVVSTLGVACAPLITWVFAPGFADEPERYELAVRMLRITFPYLFFVSLVAYAGGIMNAFGRFAVPSFAPVLLNVSMIGAALLVAPRFDPPIVALAWGVFAAGALQLALQLPFLASMGLLPRPRWGRVHAGVRRVAKLMVPALFGSSVAQINLLLDTIIASFLAAGSLSWLYYSDRLMEFPLGMLGVTLGTIILPRLSRGHTRRGRVGALDDDDFRRTVDWALRVVILTGLPAAVLLATLGAPMLATLFGYGEFSAYDTRQTSIALVASAAGLPAFLLVKVFAPTFYARQDTATPVRIGIVCLVSNMGLNLVIVLPMLALGVPAPHAGLAAASSLAGWLQAGLLYRRLVADGVYRAGPGVRRTAWRALPALAVFGAVASVGAAADWHALGAAARVGRLAAIMGVAAAAWAACLWLAGLRPAELASPAEPA